MSRDIYFDEEYANIYELNGDGKVEIYNYDSSTGKVRYVYLKREINLLEKKNYDIITPYGYGGAQFFPSKNSTLEELVLEFYKEFKKYCKKESIISEFIRFHPLEKNQKFLEKIMKVVKIGKTIEIDLYDKELMLANMKGKSRNRIRRAQKKGIQIVKDNSENSWEKFMELYYITMDKNNAKNYYYFSKEYFKNLKELLNNRITIFNAILKDEIIASMIVLMGTENIHFHLSAIDPNFYKESPNNLLAYEIALWGIENNYKKIHMGGGCGGKEDSLYRFKKTLNKNGELDFYIGKKIWNKEIYNKLCSIKNVGIDEEFFPAYRK